MKYKEHFLKSIKFKYKNKKRGSFRTAVSKFLLIISLFTAVPVLASCELPGLGSDAKTGGVVIAGGNTSERQIMAEINAGMLRHYFPDENVSIINNLGTTILVLQALKRGDANIASVMYTGTSLTGELGMEPTTDAEEALKLCQEGYLEKFGGIWLDSYGFENTYAFMVTKQNAEKYGLKKVSDLENISQNMRLGADLSWIDRKGDGYEAFKNIYGFDFGRVYPMEIGLVYSAVAANEMDIVLGYTTDGRIDSYDLVILEDDKKVFPPYDASPLIMKSLAEERPEITQILSKLIGKIDTKTMQRLNRMSDEEMIEPPLVAKTFLEENNYFENNNSAAAKILRKHERGAEK